MPRLLALALLATLPVATPATAVAVKDCPSLTSNLPACALAKKALESKQQSKISVGDIVQIDDASYTVIDAKYGPVLRRGNTIFALPMQKNSTYMKIDDAIVLVHAQTEELLELIRQAHLISS